MKPSADSVTTPRAPFRVGAINYSTPTTPRPALLVFDTTEENFDKAGIQTAVSKKPASSAPQAPRGRSRNTQGSAKNEEFQEKQISGSMIGLPGTRALPSPEMSVTMLAGLPSGDSGKKGTSPKACGTASVAENQGDHFNIVERKLRTIPMRLFLANLFFAFILVVLMHYSLLSVFEKRKERADEKNGSVTTPERPVCRSIYCRSMGTHLYYILNTSAQPCDSTFDMVCRSWIHESPASYRRAVLGAQRLYIDNVYTTTYRAMLTMPLSFREGQSMVKLAKLYRLCVNV